MTAPVTCLAPPSWRPRAACGALAGGASEASFRVLTYNLLLLPPWVPGLPPPGERARLVAERVEPGYDALLFQETFDLPARAALLSGLAARGYGHAAGLVNRGRVRAHAGLTLVSPWPIEAEEHLRYRRAIGPDRLANKGALHVVLRKGGRRVHLFGTHTQSDAVPSRRSAGVRAAQLRQLRAFVDRRAGETRDPVLIAGDLNVDWHDAAEFRSMAGILDAWWPLQPWRSKGAGRFTYDPANQLVRRQGRWFDYVLVSRRHGQPRAATGCRHAYRAPWTWSGRPRADLSDHYAVAVHLEF